MSRAEPPERYYHCRVELPNGKDAVANDLTFAELESSIVMPWRAHRPFTVAGTLVRSQDSVSGIRIVFTPQPREFYAAQHNARTHAQGIADFVTRRSLLPFSEGKDVTFTLLFEDADVDVASQPDVASTPNLIDDERLDQLRSLPRDNFDYSRLIQMCEEINASYRSRAYHAVAALTRAVLDHVPPIFGVRSFAEVANNYPGSKSFKDAMDHLQNSARKIGDAHLHTQIRGAESLPVATQVNFSNSLDFLLSEIVRLAK
jgi:hypothetical protein